MKIGIIGGVSPKAYSDFYNQLCLEYRKIKDNYPSIISYSIEISNEEELRFFKNELDKITLLHVEEEIRKACKLFKENNIDIVTICCNTLSNIFYKIAKEYDFNCILTPILSTNNYLNKNKNNSILVLATSYTIDNNLYDNVIKPNYDDQCIIDEFINNKVNKEKSHINLNQIIHKYNVNKVLLGCTDINYLDINSNIEVIDSATCLLNDCISNMVK